MPRFRTLAPTCITLVLLAAAPTALAGETATATGVVNAIDTGAKKINITHEPVPALGWPGMTMDFPLGDEASVAGIEAGAKIHFLLRKRSDGRYEVESLTALEE